MFDIYWRENSGLRFVLNFWKFIFLVIFSRLEFSFHPLDNWVSAGYQCSCQIHKIWQQQIIEVYKVCAGQFGPVFLLDDMPSFFNITQFLMLNATMKQHIFQRLFSNYNSKIDLQSHDFSFQFCVVLLTILFIFKTRH